MSQQDVFHSSRREKLIEHLFVGEVLRSLWRDGIYEADVLRAETDAAGYDVVIEVGAISRHIQLKSSARSSKTSSQKVHLELGKKSGGCVIWIQFDADTMTLGPYLWFGSKPGKPLPDITGFPVAKQTRGNRDGEKSARPNIRVINKGKFEKVATISDLIHLLFGKTPL